MRREPFALLLALALGACSDDTGILVEVHGEQLSSSPARLDTLVYVDTGGGAPDSAAWGAATPETAMVGSIDLRTTPYSVMFRPDGVGDRATVYMSAVAYDGNGTIIGFGELGPVPFSPNLVKKVELDLAPAQALANGCVVVDGEVAVRNTPDCDADGVDYSIDCNDLDPTIGADLDGDPVVCGADCNMMDPAVYPGAPEVCDGKDDDCDPITTAPPQLCVSVSTDTSGNPIECRVGEALCNDTHLGGGYAPCATVPLDVNTFDNLCRFWAECQTQPNPASCFVDGHITCDLGVKDTAICTPSFYNLIELPNLPGTQCTWQLVGDLQQGAWDIGLIDNTNPGQLSTFSNNCDAQLFVQNADLIPRVVVLEGDFGSEIDDYAVTIEPHRADCNPGETTQMACTLVVP